MYVRKCKYCPISHAHMSMCVCVCVHVHTLKIYSCVVYAVSKCTASQINSFRFLRRCKYCHISHAHMSMCVCVCVRACAHLNLVMSVVHIYSFKCTVSQIDSVRFLYVGWPNLRISEWCTCTYVYMCIMQYIHVHVVMFHHFFFGSHRCTPLPLLFLSLLICLFYVRTYPINAVCIA